MRRALFLSILVAVLGVAGATPTFGQAAAQVTVKIIAFNDVHGTLSPGGTYPVPDPSDPQKTVRVPVQGLAYLATAVQRLRAANPLNVVVAAGDLVGASPLSSALFHDEATIEVLGRLGLEISAVGNHEFDGGKDELLRKQRGGCFPGGTVGADTCLGGTFAGAAFRYLAANVIDVATGRTLLPPYTIKQFDLGGGRRVRVAFVGVVTKNTPNVTTAFGARGLRFTGEAAAVNALIPAINAAGVRAVVVLVHEGLKTRSAFNDPACTAPAGDLLPVLDGLDPSIALVVSGHTHEAYICPNGAGTKNSHALYTQAGAFGRFITDIDLTLDVASGRVIQVAANNRLVVNDRAPNPAAATFPSYTADSVVAAIIDRYAVASAPLVNRPVGRIDADFTRDGNDTTTGASGESTLADMVADSQVAATAGSPQPAVIGFMNAGGVRADLFLRPVGTDRAPGLVTYGDVFAVSPFSNILFSVSLTGAQIYALLEQQFTGKARPQIMGVSRGFSYSWDAGAPEGAKVVAGSVKLGGQPVEAAHRYRVVVNDFMLGGGDGFVALTESTERQSGVLDREALERYITARSPLSPAPRDRITRLR